MTGGGQEPDWEAYVPGTAPPPPPPAYGPPPGHPPSGHPPSGHPPYGPPPGQPPYGHAPYGYPPYGPVLPLAWPAGPGRPAAAGTALTLGFVTGGLTLAGSLFFLAVVLDGDDDLPTLLLLLGLPCAVALLAGAARVSRRRSPALLVGAAVAAVAVLALSWIAAVATLRPDGVLGVTAFVLLAVPLPVLTAVFARRPVVSDWVAAVPPDRPPG